LSLLFVGTSLATSIGGGFGEGVDQGRISLEFEPFLSVNPNLPLLKSAPGVVQPDHSYVSYDVSSHDEYGVPEVSHDEYGVPEVPHEEYGIPEVPHEEYGPPPVKLIQPVVTTEQ
jgi:hypothetical protein